MHPSSVTYWRAWQYWFRMVHTIWKVLLHSVQYNAHRFVRSGLMKQESRYSWFQTFAVFWMLYAFFWVIPRRMNFIFRRFRTLCLFHLHRRIGMKDVITIRLWRWNRWSVPKRRHIKFRRRGITQKKAYKEAATCRLIHFVLPDVRLY